MARYNAGIRDTLHRHGNRLNAQIEINNRVDIELRELRDYRDRMDTEIEVLQLAVVGLADVIRQALHLPRATDSKARHRKTQPRPAAHAGGRGHSDPKARVHRAARPGVRKLGRGGRR